VVVGVDQAGGGQASGRVDPAGASGTLAAGPSPTAVIRSPVTVMWPLRYSAPPSSCRRPSMVAIAQFSITTGPALISFPGK
jgi:hypothetical protein